MRDLRDYFNLSYESEATIAAKIGVGRDALSEWLRGKSKPTFKSLLKIREFLKFQPKIRGGIERLDMCRYRVTTRMGGEGRERTKLIGSVVVVKRV
jgi:transcriptional regulator with XRE-family HTH domain